MGYETKAFIVERYGLRGDAAGTHEKPECLHILAMTDLSKDGSDATCFGRLREQYTENPIADGRVFGLWKFGHEGMSQDIHNALFESGILDDEPDIRAEIEEQLVREDVTKDRYDCPIVLIPIQEASQALRYDIASARADKEQPYRRFIMLLALLEATMKGFPNTEELYVACYGY